MTRVKVGRHLTVNIRRRSLCDTCIADVCVRDTSLRVLECEHYRSSYLLFKCCAYCGDLFEVHRNIRALDPELCPRCNVMMANCHPSPASDPD